MAGDSEEKKGRRKRKKAEGEDGQLLTAEETSERRGKRGKVADAERKLLTGEKVEVLYSDEGLNGSWHEGMVIECGENFRLIEYIHLLSDDHHSKLIESVSVSAAIEGLATTTSKRHRGHIRPLPPLCEIQASEIKYGLCVDALVDDAWWEGVVFDCKEGSLERLIFFPDQGDQHMIMVDRLRVTQEWNEVSGQWTPRGEWLLLQVLKPFEQEQGLPVSTREIWYDLQTKIAFREKIGAWTFGSQSLWHELVSELIHELVSVANGLTIISSFPSNQFKDAPGASDDIDVPVENFPYLEGTDILDTTENYSLFGFADSSVKEKYANRTGSHDVKEIEAMRATGENYGKGSLWLSSLDKVNGKPGVCPQALSAYIVGYHSRVSSQSPFSRKGFSTTRQNARSYLLSAGWEFKESCSHVKYYVSPTGSRFYSLIKACEAWKRLEDSGSTQHSMTLKGPYDCLLHSEQGTETNYVDESADAKADDTTRPRILKSWQPVDLEAEYCPQAIELCAYGLKVAEARVKGLERTDYNISKVYLQVKKHLLALGWRVESKRDKLLRLRFISPEGKCYYSHQKACCYLMNCHEREDRIDRDEHSLIGDPSSGYVYRLVAAIHPEMISSGQDPFRHSFPTKRKKHQIEGSAKEAATMNSTYKDRSKPLSKTLDSGSLLDFGLTEVSSVNVTEDQHHTNGNFSASQKENLLIGSCEMKVPLNEDLQTMHFREAIKKYKDYIDSLRAKNKQKTSNGDTDLMRVNAKRYLLFRGWKVWRRQWHNRHESFYTSPDGKTYRSLYAACTAYLEEEYLDNTTSGLLKSLNTSNRTDAKINESSVRNSECRFHGASAAIANDDIRDTLQGEGVEEGSSDLSVLSKSEELRFSLLCSRGFKISKKRRMSSSFTANTLYGRMLSHQNGCSSCCQRFEKRKQSQPLIRCTHKSGGSSLTQSIKRSEQLVVLPSSQPASRSVLSLLVDNSVVLPRQKVRHIHKRDGHVLMEGCITHDGIKCNCCKKLYGLSNFDAHAGSNIRRPAANIFLHDGRSLLQCQMQMGQHNKPKDFQRGRLKRDYSCYPSDSICSICHDGGTLILCDNCPSSFHLQCIGLEGLPEGKWFCASCRCGICGLSEFNCDIEQFTEKTIMYCDQCEREYHVGCVRNRGLLGLTSCPIGNWFCSETCSKIFLHLRKLVGKPRSTAVKGLSWTILRSSKENDVNFNASDAETMAEHNGKLSLALKVLHECFVSMIEPRTQSDLAADILFNKQSELKRLNFLGFYTMLLESGNELISVAAFRVYGKKVAEVPLVGTRVQYRRQGMCRLLINELEKLVSGIGVERLLLPAVPQLLETWTTSFGFSVMNTSDKLKLSEFAFLNFDGTTMCQKLLRTGNHNQSTDRSSGIITSSNPEKCSIVTQAMEMVMPLTAPSLGIEACALPGKVGTTDAAFESDDSVSPPINSHSDLVGNTVQHEMSDLASAFVEAVAFHSSFAVATD